KDDDRDVRPRSNRTEDFDTAHIRQPKVENDQVRSKVGDGVQPRRAALDLAYGIAIELQTGADEPPDLRFIVDHQDLISRLAHCSRALIGGECSEGSEGELTSWFPVPVPGCGRKAYRHSRQRISWRSRDQDQAQVDCRGGVARGRHAGTAGLL